WYSTAAMLLNLPKGGKTNWRMVPFQGAKGSMHWCRCLS
ncbi:hypothetical protein EE612_022566, partial [Oryza sativa]